MKEVVYNFKKYKSNPFDFFNLLPEDWREVLLPIWEKHHLAAEVYVLLNENKIVAGGIVFKEYTEDMVCFKEDAISLLNSGSLYIGYVYVIEAERGKDLGSRWLKSIKNEFSNTNFWLTIEEEGLKGFYKKNNFEPYKEYFKNNVLESLLIFEN